MMTGAGQTRRWFIGWDVGGWNCDKNQSSRDAIVTLDANHEIVGTPWRGNLRKRINSCSSTTEWVAALFDLCGSEASSESGPVTLAIDTPLGFSDAFIQLATQSKAAASIEASSTIIEGGMPVAELRRQPPRNHCPTILDSSNSCITPDSEETVPVFTASTLSY